MGIQGYPWVYRGIQGYTWVYKGIHGYTVVYKGILGYTRVYMGIQGYTWVYVTNRFHVAVCLFSNRSQMTSKCGKNKKVAHEA